MLICENCGCVIDENDAPRVKEVYSIDTGVGIRTLATEYFLEDCRCGGRLVKATKCKECGEYFIATSCFDDVCDECLEEYQYDKANVN